MKELPKIFIIVLNYNGKDCLRNTLSGVFSIDYSNCEVVLVDNASVDGSLEDIRRNFLKVTIIKNSENVGFAAGMNVGIRYALERGAEYVLLLNYDVEVPRNFLLPLVEEMEKETTLGICSPLILSPNGAVWFSGGKINWFRMRTTHLQDKIRQVYLASDYLSGCAMFIRAQVFRQVGLLDEDYFLYYEDADFSFKAKRAGYGLAVCPQSHLVHLEKSQNENKQKIYWLVFSALIFFKKNTPFYLRPWTTAFREVRRMKNWLDIKFKKKATTELVQKAYRDFYHVK